MNVPAGHDVHTDEVTAPVDGLNLPALHVWQAVDEAMPAVGLKVPVPHGWQADDAFAPVRALKVPASQSWQDEADDKGPNVPASHGRHAVELTPPGTGLNFPTEH